MRNEEPAVDLSILSRIRKLHAKAESAKAIGSQAEAEAFAAGVQKMLLKYNLDMSQIDNALRDLEDPLVEAYSEDICHRDGRRRKKRQRWLINLARAVADAHMCSFLSIKGSSMISFYGRRQNAPVARYAYEVLARTAQELCNAAFYRYRNKVHNETGGWAVDGNFRESFYAGFVLGVATRYHDSEKEMEVQAPGTGLVVVSQLKQARDFAIGFADKKKSTAVTGRRNDSKAGHEAGYAAGRKAEAKRAMNSSGAPARAIAGSGAQ